MIKRLFIFQVILLAGLGSIVLLPPTPPIQDAALNPDLPVRATLSGWESPGELNREGSKEEKLRLAPDTEYFRRDYRREVSLSEQSVGQYRGELVDELNAGIVLSGKDLSSSIHALERCLSAQGFNIPDASTKPITLRTGQTLAVRRLVCEKAEPKSRQLSRSIAYYWFVGHDSVTSNHVRRGIRDFWDRIVHGYDQRWAYITITAYLDGGYVYDRPGPGETRKEGEDPKRALDRYSRNPLMRRPLTEDQADRLVEEFIADIGPDILKVDQIKDWPKE